MNGGIRRFQPLHRRLTSTQYRRWIKKRIARLSRGKLRNQPVMALGGFLDWWRSQTWSPAPSASWTTRKVRSGEKKRAARKAAALA